MKFEEWIKSQVEYEHLLRKYGDTMFIKHNGEYQRFEVRLASRAFDKDKPKESNNVDWVEEIEKMSEKIIGVSIAYGAQVFSLLKPNRHMHIYEMLIHPKYPDLDSFNENIVEGFITSELNFLDRKEAMIFAKQNGQIKDDTFQEHELFSEDLW